MDVGQVKAQIAAATRDADIAIGLLAKVTDTIDDALGGAQHTTHDSQHPKVTGGLAKLGQARQDIDRIVNLLGASIRSAETYVGRIG
jgi:hypothetical protein